MEARDGLVAETNRISKNLGTEFLGLNFVKGDILDFSGLELPVKRVERDMTDIIAGSGRRGRGEIDEDAGGVGGEGGEGEEANWNENVKKAERTVKRGKLKTNKMNVLPPAPVNRRDSTGRFSQSHRLIRVGANAVSNYIG